MATSGSTNFSMTLTEIVGAALRKTSRYASGQSIPSEDFNDARQALNVLIKEWQADGIGIWLNTEAVLFLDDSTQRYALGGTAKCVPSESITATQISTAGSSSDLTVTVDSTTGITTSDVCGVVLDDGTILWTTCTVTDATTLTLATALTDDVAVDNYVYTYTSTNVITRPLDITECRLRDNSGNDVPVEITSREEYMALSNKASTGKVNQVYFDRQRDDANLYVWPVTSSEKDRLYMTIRRTVEDFDSVSNNADFPVECTRALIWNLADEIKIEYGVDQVTSAEIERKAFQYLKRLKTFDVSDTSVSFSFRRR